MTRHHMRTKRLRGGISVLWPYGIPPTFENQRVTLDRWEGRITVPEHFTFERLEAAIEATKRKPSVGVERVILSARQAKIAEALVAAGEHPLAAAQIAQLR